MPTVVNQISAIPIAIGADGAHIQELAGRSCGITSHSLARIVHPAGTGSRTHHHQIADEVYFILAGQGTLRVGTTTTAIGPGAIIKIMPGQPHEVRNGGSEDLVMLVTCSPAYDLGDVYWDAP